MASGRPDWRRKRRTRGHVIADLGVNYVERQALLCGFSVERFTHDYGIDLSVFTYDDNGEAEGGYLALQVKSTDRLATHSGGATFAIRVDAADLRRWLFESMPVILAVYDAASDRAFWLDVKQYARDQEIDEEDFGQTVTIRVPLGNVLDPDSVRSSREVKQRLGDWDR